MSTEEDGVDPINLASLVAPNLVLNYVLEEGAEMILGLEEEDVPSGGGQEAANLDLNFGLDDEPALFGAGVLSTDDLLDLEDSRSSVVSVNPPQQISEPVPPPPPAPAPKKPTALDEYLAASSTFRPGANEFLVDCLICEKTFINTSVTSLENHLKTKDHLLLASVTEPDGLDKKTLLHRCRMMAYFDFLVRTGTGATLTCQYCLLSSGSGPGSAAFTIDPPYDRSAILQHGRSAAHLANLHRPLDAEGEVILLAPTPRYAPPPRQQTEELKAEAIRRELERHPDVLAVKADGLYCVPCAFRFDPTRAESYHGSVRGHLQTARHAEMVRRAKALTPVQIGRETRRKRPRQGDSAISVLMEQTVSKAAAGPGPKVKIHPETKELLIGRVTSIQDQIVQTKSLKGTFETLDALVRELTDYW